MKIGIAAATAFEVGPVNEYIGQRRRQGLRGNIQVVITGIGAVATTYRLTRYIAEQQPDILLQAGIGGTFAEEFPPGEVAIISEEVIGDLGAAEQGGFKDIFDLGLQDAGGLPFHDKRLVNPHLKAWEKYGIPFAKGITVNEITTLLERVTLLRQKYGCDIESMEGAALHYVCLQEKVAFLQLRAVSNYIGERDKRNWKMAESIQRLNDSLIAVIEQILQQ